MIFFRCNRDKFLAIFVSKLELSLVLKKKKISKPLVSQTYTLYLIMLSSRLVHGTTLEVSGQGSHSFELFKFYDLFHDFFQFFLS